MMFKLLAILGCLCLAYSQDQKLGMFGMINMLYLKADVNLDGTITQSELDDIFKGFDKNKDSKVTSSEFVPLWKALTQFSTELSNAYFYLADLNADGVIDHKDETILYSRFDSNGNGKVSAEEFNHKWQDIYKESSFAVLFERSDNNKDEHLSKGEFANLFESLDTNKDHSVTKAEFETNWMKENFGNKIHADALFMGVDINHDHKLTSYDTNHLFQQYDGNHDKHVDLIELTKPITRQYYRTFGISDKSSDGTSVKIQKQLRRYSDPQSIRVIIMK